MTDKSSGLNSQVKFSIYNNNLYNDNVTGLKENANIDNYLTIASEANYEDILGKSLEEIQDIASLHQKS